MRCDHRVLPSCMASLSKACKTLICFITWALAEEKQRSKQTSMHREIKQIMKRDIGNNKLKQQQLVWEELGAAHGSSSNAPMILPVKETLRKSILTKLLSSFTSTARQTVRKRPARAPPRPRRRQHLQKLRLPASSLWRCRCSTAYTVN